MSTPVIHKSVLINEVLEYLNPQPGKTYLDVTFGAGGHTRAILEAEKKCKVIALDWDSSSIDRFMPEVVEKYGDRFTLLFGNFANLYKILKKAGIDKVDGILADFGTSQMQIFERAGFSLYRDTPLDMRMSPAHQKITAAHIINKDTPEKLQQIFFELGEERFARKIAHYIVQERKKKPIVTTGQLASLIERIVPFDKKKRIHPATKVFQALRIYVNKELENIRAFLPAATRALAPGGRLVCISFHSLEDRMVKQFLKEKEDEGVLKPLSKKVVVATKEEIIDNPSARSARLRAAERVR